MNIESILKMVPASMLNDVLSKQLVPAMAGLAEKAAEGVELKEGETEVQTLIVSRKNSEGQSRISAVVVALDEDLKITRHIKKFDLNELGQMAGQLLIPAKK